MTWYFTFFSPQLVFGPPHDPILLVAPLCVCAYARSPNVHPKECDAVSPGWGLRKATELGMTRRCSIGNKVWSVDTACHPISPFPSNAINKQTVQGYGNCGGRDGMEEGAIAKRMTRDGGEKRRCWLPWRQRWQRMSRSDKDNISSRDKPPQNKNQQTKGGNEWGDSDDSGGWWWPNVNARGEGQYDIDRRMTSAEAARMLKSTIRHMTTVTKARNDEVCSMGSGDTYYKQGDAALA